ncbi:hypothetical protein DPMN_009349 [Dreissena polymorpha]|uniref:Uncharacterized protein n=1 Tax=Dreissena polymorpha TaxID=45954 RepID=A0A9D4N0B9_DREPO|nr:hypothetical protein DPMN_009349 [Dreissena polymorpha]
MTLNIDTEPCDLALARYSVSAQPKVTHVSSIYRIQATPHTLNLPVFVSASASTLFCDLRRLMNIAAFFLRSDFICASRSAWESFSRADAVIRSFKRCSAVNINKSYVTKSIILAQLFVSYVWENDSEMWESMGIKKASSTTVLW